jgi:hypothetical protein
MISQGLLLVKEAASYLTVSPGTVYRLEREGYLPSRKEVKMGIISPFKQIREPGLESWGGSRKDVRACPCLDCELWGLRFGRKKKSALRKEGQNSENLTNKEDFNGGNNDETKTKIS